MVQYKDYKGNFFVNPNLSEFNDDSYQCFCLNYSQVSLNQSSICSYYYYLGYFSILQIN